MTFRIEPTERTAEAVMHLAVELEDRAGTAWLERDNVAVTVDLEGDTQAAREDQAKKLVVDALAKIELEPLGLD